ncbi:hypothetical protein PIB30_003324 [Stylosanthes scabra]|uniref:Uncharacterized protein n=1 Tax=Stylosanthes scabra TaxID=79078 RepID=A0ABU6S2Y8_9FABA|nr:hypothetical protein [Stylosanthes scabra]
MDDEDKASSCCRRRQPPSFAANPSRSSVVPSPSPSDRALRQPELPPIRSVRPCLPSSNHPHCPLSLLHAATADPFFCFISLERSYISLCLNRYPYNEWLRQTFRHSSYHLHHPSTLLLSLPPPIHSSSNQPGLLFTASYWISRRCCKLTVATSATRR